MKLRSYQDRLVDAVFEMWRKFRTTLIVAATGTGKTIIFAEVILRSQPGRALVLAHRNELIQQAREKIEGYCGLPCEIEKADLFATTNLFHATPVVVSSIQTQCSGPKGRRRYTRFKPTDFSVLICDEGHHAAAPSWREVIDYYRQNPNLKVLGVTATPDRADSEALGQVFESVAGTYDILDAIQDGYLVDITQQFVTVQGLDYSEIRTTAGDLNEGELAKVLEIERNVQGICQPILEVMHGLPPQTLKAVPVADWRSYLTSLSVRPRRTIVFAVSVLQSETYCDVLSRAMAGVEWVCGATRKEDRAAILSRFSNGETHAVINCAVLTEGFDNPGVEVIVMARPTKSRSLYAQMVGRSTRPLFGVVDGADLDTPEKRRASISASPKPFCRILDFVGNSGKHKLVTCLDILGGHVTPDATAFALKKAQKEGKPVRVLRTITNAEKEVERLKAEAVERRRHEEAERKKHLLVRSQYSMRNVNPFDRLDSMATRTDIKRGGKQFSIKQATFIRKWCGKDPNQIPYGYGVKLIQQKLSEWDKRKATA